MSPPDTPPTTLSWAEHLRRTLALGLPLIGAQIAQMAISFTDTLMIGRLGSTELAAAVLGTQLVFLVLITISGFGIAVTPIVARADSIGDQRGVRRAVRMGNWAVTAISAIAMVPLFWSEQWFLFTGQDPQVSALAADYVEIALFTLIPATIIFVLRSFLSALERTQVVLWTTILGVIANAFFDYVLIFGKFGMPAMGVRGAAFASVGTMLVMMSALIVYTLVVPALAKLEIWSRFWRLDGQALSEVLRLGWPIGLTLLAEVGLFTASSYLIGWVGTVPLAAHGIALQIVSMIFMVPLGLSQAATVRVGRAAGRDDKMGVGRAGLSAIYLTLVIALFAAALLILLPEPLIRAFLDPSNLDTADIIAQGTVLLAVAAAFQIADMVQIVSVSVLRGLRDTAIPMAIALVSYWVVGIPVAALLAFPLGFGAPGVWMGLAAGLALAALLLTARFVARERFGLV